MSLNRIFVGLVAALVVISSSSILHAQGRGRGGFGQMGGPQAIRMNMLSIPKVQENLKLSDEQKGKIEAIVEKLRSERQSAFADFQNASDEERQKKFAELQEKAKTSGEEAGKVLSKEQLERLDQIGLQALGANALADERVASELKLTDEQKAKLMGVRQEMFAKMQELGREAPQEKRAELRKETNDKALAVLTDEQRTQFAKMQGEKIDLPPGAAFGFGGGRRPGQ
jgi:Spy/CpxP family protein refolding chaperone